MSTYKMVVFDIAGTTIEENNLVYHTIHQCLINEKINCSFEMVLKFCAGMEKKEAILTVVKAVTLDSNEDLINRIYDAFVENLKLNYQNAEIQPMPFAHEVFETLKHKGIKVILNTGYNREVAGYLLSRLQWNVGVQIDGLVTASDVEAARPDPAMIKLAMRQFDISKSSQVVKIGDSIIDIEEGMNAKCGLVLGITTGAHTYNQLKSASPNAIIKNLGELLNYI